MSLRWRLRHKVNRLDLSAVSVLFFGYAALFLVGIGPALWLAARNTSNRVALAICIAPVIGLAETGLVFYPLILNDLPIAQTALPVTLLLLSLSITLAILDVRSNYSAYRRIARRSAFGFTALAFAISILFLLLPPLVGGQKTQFWQYSPWDAISYMKMAEYAKHFPVSYSVSLNHAQEILQFNPAFSVIFSSNLMLARPAASNSLAWLSTLNDSISIVNGYYFLKLLYAALVFGPTLAICKKLNMSLRRSAACAIVLSVGFWTGLAINLDALSQLSSLSLSLLVLFAFLCLENNETDAFINRSRILVGLALAAVMVFYPESIYLIATVIAFYYLLRLIYRRPSWKQRVSIVREIVSIGIIALLFQLPDLHVTLGFFLRQAQTARGNFTWPTFYFDWLVDGVPFRDIWGLHFFQSSANPLLNLILGTVTFLVGGILTIYVIRGIRYAITQRKATLNDKLLAAFVVMFWSVGLVLLLFQQAWVAGKVLSWGYAFVIIALFLYAGELFRKIPIFRFAFAFWLVSQFINPAFHSITYVWTNQYPLYSSQIFYEDTAEIDPALTSLITNQPRSLGVDVSDLTSRNSPLAAIWTFAVGNLAKTEAVSGDGGYTPSPSIWWQESDAVPDQLLLSKGRDFLSALQLGKPLVDNAPYFILSAVTPDELDQALMYPSILDPFAIAAVALTDADQPYLINGQGSPVRWTRQRIGEVPMPEQTLLRFWASGDTALAAYLRYTPNFTGSVEIGVNHSIVIEQTLPSPGEQEAIFCIDKPGINTVELNYSVEQLLNIGQEEQRLLLREAFIARNGILNVGSPAEQLFVGDGWYLPEQWDTRYVRWSGQNSQVVLLTCTAPSTLRFRAYTASDEERIVTLTLNGESLGSVGLQAGWHEYSLPILPDAYRPHQKQILRLSHDTANIPLDDTRALSAAYEWFTFQ